MTNGIWWFFMISTAFHWSLTISLFFEHRRKDFYQMFAHHMITVLLSKLTWICNLQRAACLTIVVHYWIEVILEGGKALNYAKFKRATNVLFCIFAITWIITRLIIFPQIIYNSMLHTLNPPYPATIILNALLVGLMILHIIWTCAIFKAAIRSIKSGGVQKDIRSDSDELIDENQP